MESQFNEEPEKKKKKPGRPKGTTNTEGHKAGRKRKQIDGQSSMDKFTVVTATVPVKIIEMPS